MIKYFLTGTALVLLSGAITAQAATCNGKKVTTTITQPGTYNGIGDAENVVLIKSAKVEYYGGNKADSICIADRDTSSWIILDNKNFFWGVVVHGGKGNDYIKGSNQDDVIYGDDGDDTIGGRDGDDLIWGNRDNDKLYGDAGSDIVEGGGHADRIYGGSGRDLLVAGEYNKFSGLGALQIDWVKEGFSVFHCSYSDADDQNDFGLPWEVVDAMANAHPSNADDIIFGDNGLEKEGDDDLIFGSNGDNQLFGNGGCDIVFGYKGNDLIHGDAGDDFLSGGPGGDTLRGLGDNDMLMGNEDDDVLKGGTGYDECYEEDEHESWDNCDD